MASVFQQHQQTLSAKEAAQAKRLKRQSAPTRGYLEPTSLSKENVQRSMTPQRLQTTKSIIKNTNGGKKEVRKSIGFGGTDKSRRVSFSSNLVDIKYFDTEDKLKDSSISSGEATPVSASPAPQSEAGGELLAFTPVKAPGPATNPYDLSSLSSTPFRATAPSVVPSTPVQQQAEESESTVTIEKPGDFPTRTQSLDAFFLEANSELIDELMTKGGEQAKQNVAAAAQARNLPSPAPTSSINLMNFSEEGTASLHQRGVNTQGFAPIERRLSMSAFKSPEPLKSAPQARSQLLQNVIPQSPAMSAPEEFSMEKENFVSGDQMNRLLFGSPVGMVSDAGAHDDRRRSIGDFMSLIGGSPTPAATTATRRQSVGMDLTEVGIAPIETRAEEADDYIEPAAVRPKRLRRDSLGAVFELGSNKTRRGSLAMDLTGTYGGILGASAEDLPAEQQQAEQQQSAPSSPVGEVNRTRRESLPMELSSPGSIVDNKRVFAEMGGDDLEFDSAQTDGAQLTTSLRTKRFSMDMDHTGVVGGIIGMSGERTTSLNNQTRRMSMEMDHTGVIGGIIAAANLYETNGSVVEPPAAQLSASAILEDGELSAQLPNTHASFSSIASPTGLTANITQGLTRRLSLGMDMTEALTSHIRVGPLADRRKSLAMELTQSLPSTIMTASTAQDSMDVEPASANVTEEIALDKASASNRRRKSLAMDETQMLPSQIQLGKVDYFGDHSTQLTSSAIISESPIAFGSRRASLAAAEQPAVDVASPVVPSDSDMQVDQQEDRTVEKIAAPEFVATNQVLSPPDAQNPVAESTADELALQQLREALQQSAIGDQSVTDGLSGRMDDFITPTSTGIFKELADFPFQTPAFPIQRPQPSEAVSLDKFLGMTGINFAAHRRSSFSIPVVMEPKSENSRLHSVSLSAPLAAQVFQPACAKLEAMIQASKQRVAELEAKLRENPPALFSVAYQAQASQAESAKMRKTMKSIKSAVKYEVKKTLNDEVLGEVLEKKRGAVIAEAVQSLEKDAQLILQAQITQQRDLDSLSLERENFLLEQKDRQRSRARASVVPAVLPQDAPPLAVAQDGYEIFQMASGWSMDSMAHDALTLSYGGHISLAEMDVKIELQLNDGSRGGMFKSARCFATAPDTSAEFATFFVEAVNSIPIGQYFAQCNSEAEVPLAFQQATHHIARVVDALNEISLVKKSFVMRQIGRLAPANEDSAVFFFNLVFSSQVGNRIQVSILFDAGKGEFVGYKFQKSLPSTTVAATAVQRIFDSSTLFDAETTQPTGINTLRHRALRNVCGQLKQLVATADAPAV